jgi:hypothetical protein
MRQRRKDLAYRWFFVAFTLALVVLATCKANAGPDRVSILTNSNHIGFRYQGFNETNPGLFLTWDNAIAPNVDLSVGGYLNSYAKPSMMIAATWLPIEVGQCEAGVFAGVVHYPGNGRYEPTSIAGSDVIGMGGGQVICGPVFMQVIPAATDLSRAIVAVGITMEIGQ